MKVLLIIKPYFFVSILLSFLLFTDCVYSQNAPVVKKVTFEDTAREYLLYIPKKLSKKKPVPLLICLHGYGDSAYMFMYNTRFNDIAERENFIVVYPQGTLFKDSPFWNTLGYGRSKINDLGFLENLVYEISKDYNIDQTRIYAAGMSNGGFMAMEIACSLSHIFTAVASVTGTMTNKLYESCNPSENVSVLQIHGTLDRQILYNGNKEWSISVPTLLEFWSKTNKLNERPKIKTYRGESPYNISKYSYLGDRKNKTEVVHFKIEKGEHQWYNFNSSDSNTTSELVWDFLSKKSKKSN